MDFLDLADGAALHEGDGGLVLGTRVDLNAHLRTRFFLAGHFSEAAYFEDVVGKGFLPIDRQVAAHGFHRDWRVHVVGRADADDVEVLVLFVENRRQSS